MTDEGSARSYLGPGCVLDGEITGHGSIECHGTVTGRIRLDGDVVIGERGSAKADLYGGRVKVDGVLLGNATGGERVEVGSSGQVTGDIRAPSVSFGEGAIFEGNVEMRSARKAGGTD
jgi:cytoskeletal protein CcmA (bactofilin family)